MGSSQLLQISDPWLMAEFLDRNKYPELVDKPQEPMFYRSFDEVPPFPVSVPPLFCPSFRTMPACVCV